MTEITTKPFFYALAVFLKRRAQIKNIPISNNEIVTG
jgi:hypothetical protein